MKPKDQSIETLRGIAIILVVAGYIIEGNLTDGPGTHSFVAALLHFIYYVLIPIRMPLFTVISAYLYAASPATQNTLNKLIVGKTRRILRLHFSLFQPSSTSIFGSFMLVIMGHYMRFTKFIYILSNSFGFYARSFGFLSLLVCLIQ